MWKREAHQSVCLPSSSEKETGSILEWHRDHASCAWHNTACLMHRSLPHHSSLFKLSLCNYWVWVRWKCVGLKMDVPFLHLCLARFITWKFLLVLLLFVLTMWPHVIFHNTLPDTCLVIIKTPWLPLFIAEIFCYST